MQEIQINYLAVGISALLPILIGTLWYSPLLFGRSWTEAHGYSPEQMRSMSARALPVSVLSYIVMALVLAVLIAYGGVSTAQQGALLGLLVWVGFLATLGLTSHVYSERPWSIYCIDASFQLIYIASMGATLAVWR